jgi:TetR/AcrR family transcriptional regulator
MSRDTHPRTQPRRPGRPPIGTVDARERLLDAGAQEFAERGFHGATVRDIAARAGLTSAALHYHFDHKQGLIEALVEERFVPLIAGTLQPALAAKGPVRVRIEAMLRGYTAALAARPWLPALIVREVLSDGGVLRETFLARFAGPVAGRLPELIAEGQKNGELRNDLDPRLAALSLMSIAVFPFAAAAVVDHAFGLRKSPDWAERLAAHSVRTLFEGIGT